jgi:hypothetical protein
LLIISEVNMKADLKRIKATLQNLGISTASYPKPPTTENRSYSFEIGSTTQKGNSAATTRQRQINSCASCTEVSTTTKHLSRTSATLISIRA